MSSPQLEDRSSDRRVKKGESSGKDGQVEGRLDVDPGPGTILLSSRDSTEYANYVSDFCSRNMEKRDLSQKYPDIGVPEVWRRPPQPLAPTSLFAPN